VKLALKSSVLTEKDWNFYWDSIDKIVQNVRKLDSSSYQDSNDKDVQFEQMVPLFQAQLDGMLFGYNQAKLPEDDPVTMPQLYFLNFGGSLSEMYQIFKYQYEHVLFEESASFLQNQMNLFKKSGGRSSQIFKNDMKTQTELKYEGHCNAFVKVLKDENGKINDFLFGHTTYDYYQNTIKYMKSIDITLGNNHWKVLFPSYPGVIFSGDDYYLTKNGLLITETSLSILNRREYRDVAGVNTKYPDFMRVMGATLIAKNGRDWIDLMRKTNSGSYSSQWMIFDLNKFKESLGADKLKKGTFYVAEQSSEALNYKDFSNMQPDGKLPFWSSFNIPYFEKTLEELNNKNFFSDDIGTRPINTYMVSPKYQIFDSYNENINSIDDFKKLMRMNRFGLDTNIDPSEEIASRGDLNSNTFYGATDVKVINYALAQKGAFLAEFGPTHDDVAPFSWPKSIYSKLSGLPETYNFDWVEFQLDE